MRRYQQGGHRRKPPQSSKWWMPCETPYGTSTVCKSRPLNVPTALPIPQYPTASTKATCRFKREADRDLSGNFLQTINVRSDILKIRTSSSPLTPVARLAKYRFGVFLSLRLFWQNWLDRRQYLLQLRSENTGKVYSSLTPVGSGHCDDRHLSNTRTVSMRWGPRPRQLRVVRQWNLPTTDSGHCT